LNQKNSEIKSLEERLKNQNVLAEKTKKMTETKAGLQEVFARFASLEHCHLNKIMDECIKDAGSHGACHYLKGFLNPEVNIEATLVTIFDFLVRFVGPANGLRVALFVPKDGYLYVKNSFDGDRPRCVHSPNHHNRNFFLLDTASMGGIASSAATHISLSTREAWISRDAALDHDKPNVPFRYFDDGQRERIGSYFVFKALAHSSDLGEPCPVIMCDTPVVIVDRPQHVATCKSQVTGVEQ